MTENCAALPNTAQAELNLFDLFGMFLALIGTGSVFLAFFGCFNLQNAAMLALASLVIVCIPIRSSLRLSKCLKVDFRLIFSFAALGLYATTLRLPSYSYLSAGVDPGLYMATAAEMNRSGSFYLKDPMFGVSKKEISKAGLGTLPNYVEDEAGVYFPFYPLFSTMLAIFGGLFGEEHRSESNVLFGVLVVLASVWLSFEICKRWWKAFVVGTLFAIHPLLIFESRLPVTETSALFFTIMSLGYLARYLNLQSRDSLNAVEPQRYSGVGLLLAALIHWNAFLYTRMNSFLYFPLIVTAIAFIAIQGISAAKTHPSQATKGPLLMTLFMMLLLSLLSYQIYRIFIPNLYADILVFYLKEALGEQWLIFISVTGLIMGAFIAICSRWRVAPVDAIFNWIRHSSRCSKIFLAIASLILLVHSLKYFHYALSGRFEILTFYNRLAKLRGLELIASLSIWNIMLYLSPVGLYLLARALWRRNATTPGFVLFLMLGLVLMTILNVVTRPYLHGGYYYARYLMSDILPFGLVIGVLAYLPDVDFREFRFSVGKRLKWTTIVVMGLYFLYPSLKLWQGPEGPKGNFFMSIDSEIGENDLLLYSSHQSLISTRNETAAPIAFDLGKQVAVIRSFKRLRQALRSGQFANFSRVYLLSQELLDYDDVGDLFRLVRSLNFESGMYHNNTGHLYLPWAKWSGLVNYEIGWDAIGIPVSYSQFTKTYYLYRHQP